MSDVSIVIVSFNTCSLLDKCISHVYAGSPELDREVIVVENASADGSREMLAEKWPRVKVILNDDNRGYAPACNQGLRIAGAKYVMALNSDAFLVGDALGKMIGFMDANPDVCALTPKLFNEDGSIQYTCARGKIKLRDQLLYYSMFSRWFPKLAQRGLSVLPEDRYAVTCDVEVLGGAALFVRKEALDKVGLLDDRLFVNYDDIEWCQRATRMGCRLVYYPEAEAVHIGCASRQFDADTMFAANYRTIFTYFGIVYSRPLTALLKLTVLCSLLDGVIRSAIQAPFRPRSRKALAHRARMLAKVTGMAFGRN